MICNQHASVHGHFLDMDKNQVSMFLSQVSIIQDHMGITPSILYAHKPLDYCLPRVAQTVKMCNLSRQELANSRHPIMVNVRGNMVGYCLEFIRGIVYSDSQTRLTPTASKL